MIAIVGAGITGLTLGMLLKKQGTPFILLEASARGGGNIQSFHEGGYLMEQGPNSLRLNDQLYHWLEELQLESEIVKSLPTARNRYILKQGRYKKLPSGPPSLLTNATLSWKAKQLIWKERKNLSKSAAGESVDGFFRRRLGDEIVDYVVQPFVSGIFAGDPKKLLMEAAFPRLVEMEKLQGSLIRGMIQGRKKQQHTGIFSFKNGLGSWVSRLEELLAPNIQYNCRVSRLFSSDPIHLEIDEGTGIDADSIVLCLPAHQIAKLLGESYPQVAKDLSEIYYPPVSLVYSAYKKKHVKHSLLGFGALHNHLEPSNTLGTIFSSSVFPERCPADEVLLTTFVGGALYPNRATQADRALLDSVLEDHQRFLGVKNEPVFQQIKRWERAIPQYEPSILKAWSKESLLQKHGIWLGGNWIGGIAVGACVERAFELANELGK